MTPVQISEQDVMRAEAGVRVILPALDGGSWALSKARGVSRLRRMATRDILDTEKTTREGEAVETPPVVS